MGESKLDEQQQVTQQTMMTTIVEQPDETSQNKANKEKSSTQNNNQPDRKGGNLPCQTRQPLNVAPYPPNWPSRKVVKNGRVSFAEVLEAKNGKILGIGEHGTSLMYIGWSGTWEAIQRSIDYRMM
jgi:hypothetical protein